MWRSQSRAGRESPGLLLPSCTGSQENTGSSQSVFPVHEPFDVNLRRSAFGVPGPVLTAGDIVSSGPTLLAIRPSVPAIAGPASHAVDPALDESRAPPVVEAATGILRK